MLQKQRHSSEVCTNCKVLEEENCNLKCEVHDLKGKLEFCLESIKDLEAGNKNLQDDCERAVQEISVLEAENVKNKNLQDDYEKAVQQISMLKAEKKALAETFRDDISKAIKGLFSFFS